MVGLVDITLVTREVSGVTVSGVSAHDLGKILWEFPEVRKAIQGGGSFDAQTIMTIAPRAIGVIIAAGCGEGDNPKAVDKAARLPVGLQVEFLEAVVEVSFPNGVGAFLQVLRKVLDSINDEEGGALSALAPDSKSPKRSRAS